MISAQSGDQADYRLLLGEIGQVLERYFCARIGAGAYVDDCVQEVLLAVHEARHTYDPGRPFRPWLFAIARHKAIDRLRQETRLREDPLSEDASDWQDAAVVDVEASVAGRRMIDALSAQYREPIMLTKIAGFSSAEAAATLKISESALKVRVHRGIKRLRRMLEAEPL